MVASGMLCPRMGEMRPSSLYLPWRGPKTNTAARAAKPPKAWTMEEPAKS